ncbi:MAG: acyl carrier protein [Spartobacteria bacterium]|nr:acyl carrier protein [Spartobacteria bacterium]
MDELKQQIKDLLIKRLRLKTTPDAIADDAPLFGDGLGLDSIDALELSIAVEKTFGVEIRDAEQGLVAFQSINALAAYIQEKRGETPPA